MPIPRVIPAGCYCYHRHESTSHLKRLGKVLRQSCSICVPLVPPIRPYPRPRRLRAPGLDRYLDRSLGNRTVSLSSTRSYPRLRPRPGRLRALGVPVGQCLDRPLINRHRNPPYRHNANLQCVRTVTSPVPRIVLIHSILRRSRIRAVVLFDCSIGIPSNEPTRSRIASTRTYAADSSYLSLSLSHSS